MAKEGSMQISQIGGNRQPLPVEQPDFVVEAHAGKCNAKQVPFLLQDSVNEE